MCQVREIEPKKDSISIKFIYCAVLTYLALIYTSLMLDLNRSIMQEI